ncbi:M15 family metallopeptidase [Candidatus Saccharibacteria bacterium]|nr:M15 family metallopeptidase [Candidatus Saccharibacteria bacterium]
MKKVISLLVAMFLVASLSAAFAEIPVEILDNPYLILINKENKLPDEWTSMVNFSVGKNSLGELHIVEAETLEQFEALRAYLLETEGIQIELDSIYRSLDEQQEIWDAWSADPELGPEYCEQYLAPVGCSEHHTGLAIDVFLIKDGEVIRDNDAMIAETEIFAKIHQHLAEFGFILRYLPGKEDITGYSYEPWHFRYIGNPTLAKSITTAGITFEEYYDLLQSTFN